MELCSELLQAYFIVVLFVSVATVECSTENEGFPGGLISSCPNSEKPASIKPETLKKLFISVMSQDYKIKAYDYYHIGNLAKNPDLDFNRKTFMYVGGYVDTTIWPFSWGMGRIYKRLGYNVLLLDTLEFTARLYPHASQAIRAVGKYAARMLFNLTTHGLDPKKLELVGLSLGGQTMSFIAKHFRQMSGRNISSLTGLDTAGPCFRNLGPDQRLDASDADFVLAIVTNMDGFGMGAPVGHVTFYVNGGEYQPGDITWLPCGVLCSHIRSYFLWISALNNPGTFVAVRCDSVQQAKDADCFGSRRMVTNTLDLLTDRSKPGIYYLQTTNSNPYYMEKEGLKKIKSGMKELSRPLENALLERIMVLLFYKEISPAPLSI